MRIRGLGFQFIVLFAVISTQGVGAQDLCARELSKVAKAVESLKSDIETYWKEQKRKPLVSVPWQATRVVFAPTSLLWDLSVGGIYHWAKSPSATGKKDHPWLYRFMLIPAEAIARNAPNLGLYLLMANAGISIPVGQWINGDDTRNLGGSADEPWDDELLKMSPYRPDLYLDGENLADRLTGWILGNTTKEKRSKHHGFFPGKMSKLLYSGNAFPTEIIPEDREMDMMDWVNEQPKNSLTPEAVLQEAIRRSEGDVEAGLFLCWNLMRNSWKSTDRNKYQRARRLVDITGERAVVATYGPSPDKIPSFLNFWASRSALISGEKPKSIRGDNYSAWYHFFGTALSSFHKSRSISTLYSPIIAEAQTNAMIFVEEDLLFGEFNDARKRKAIDQAGARFGAQLAKNLAKYETVSDFQASHPQAGNGEYLYDNSSYYGEKWSLKPGQRPWEYQDPYPSLLEMVPD